MGLTRVSKITWINTTMKSHLKHSLCVHGLSSLALSFSSSTQANTDVSYNITFASHYNWHGFDLTDGFYVDMLINSYQYTGETESSIE